MPAMKHLWIVLVVVACGSKPPPPPANQGSGTATGSEPGSGSATQPADCPERIDCMPPVDEPCPPPGLQERCPNTMITH
jgi:hypothetical protein